MHDIPKYTLFYLFAFGVSALFQKGKQVRMQYVHGPRGLSGVNDTADVDLAGTCSSGQQSIYSTRTGVVSLIRHDSYGGDRENEAPAGGREQGGH